MNLQLNLIKENIVNRFIFIQLYLILYNKCYAMFFNDDSMNKIYKNKAAFDFIDQLPQIIYSFIISMLFSF